MKVYLNEVTGIPDAIESLFMSKRSWVSDKATEVRDVCKVVLDDKGNMIPLDSKCRDIEVIECYQKFNKWMATLCKLTIKHITLGKFIDFSFTVEGLHRGGQDDWDSHAQRFDNRIIRNSTRLSLFGNEKSAFYRDKILSTDEVLSLAGIPVPGSIEVDGVTYVKAVNGYVREDCKDDKDVLRGLYMLSIPSTFIYKCNLTQFAHVYKERNNNSSAHPEVKQCAENCAYLIHKAIPFFDDKLFLDIKN